LLPGEKSSINWVIRPSCAELEEDFAMLISFVKRFCLPMILLLMIAACAAPAATPAPKSEGDIEFVPGGGAFQSLDVYLPTEGDGPFTTILMIHGQRRYIARSLNT
jgi:hypothetical protein